MKLKNFYDKIKIELKKSELYYNNIKTPIKIKILWLLYIFESILAIVFCLKTNQALFETSLLIGLLGILFYIAIRLSKKYEKTHLITIMIFISCNLIFLLILYGIFLI
jgi:hypothetical protein